MSRHKIFVLGMVLFLGLVAMQRDAAALCVADPLDGAWKNFSSGRWNSRLDYYQQCDDVILVPCDSPQGPCYPPAPDYTVGRLSIVNAAVPRPSYEAVPLMPMVQAGIWVRGSYNNVTSQTYFLRYDKAGAFAELVEWFYDPYGHMTEYRDYFRKTPLATFPDTDMMGSDYKGFLLPTPDWTSCESSCAADTRCKAYTYVPPGIKATSAACFLKSSVPLRSAHSGMVSGYRR
jgi:hypothetical protein